MEKYGAIRNGKVLEVFNSEEEGAERCRELLKEGELVGLRKLRFNELSEDEKLQSMKQKLNKLGEFLEEVEGSGRSYYSHTNIKFDELRWLIQSTEKNIGES